MIKVEFQREPLMLTMCGHAGQGARGSDVVCAAASVLLFTLLSELIRLGAEHQRQMQPGYAKICAKGGEAVFDCVCTGLMLLAENYPQAVSFEETSGRALLAPTGYENIDVIEDCRGRRPQNYNECEAHFVTKLVESW